jgi:hypothetical protein
LPNGALSTQLRVLGGSMPINLERLGDGI